MAFDDVPSIAALAGNIEPMMTDAETLVNERFSSALTYADEAYNKTMVLIDSLRTAAGAIRQISVDDVWEDLPEPLVELVLPHGIEFPDMRDFVDLSLLDDLDIDTSALGDIQIPDITDNLNNIVPPATTFSWSDETGYLPLDSVLSNLYTALWEMYNTPVSLTGTVAQTLMDEEKERDVLANQEARAQLENEWAAGGWDIPDAVLFANISKVDVDYQNKQLDKSRAIYIEAYKMAVENMRFAATKIGDIAGQLMGYMTAMMNRKLEAAKFLLTAAIEVFKAEVELVAEKVRLYIAKLEAVKTKIQVVGESIRAQSEVIRAKSTAIDAEARVYASAIEGYKAAVGAAIEELNAKIAEYEQNVKLMVSKVSLTIEIQKAEIQEYVENTRTLIEAIKSGGQLAANLTAGALSGISAQAHISRSDQMSASGSVSYSGVDQVYKDMTPVEE